MDWYIFDSWIVIVGALAALACALPGCFLVLRHMSMMGDAISHAVLPGLAIAFLVSGTRASWPMFIGAAVVGVLTAVFTQWVSNLGKVDRGASMGIVFTTLFAIGLLLIVQAADRVDLDPGCVLYGAIELTPLDVAYEFEGPGVEALEFTLLGREWYVEIADPYWEIPWAAVILGIVALINLALIVVLFKEFRIAAFDPALATTLGINATFMHYLLMAMVAVTTVAAFEAVGSIIVIAMLVVPAATAYLLMDRLTIMLVLSAIFGVLAAILGHVSALTLPPLIGYESTSTSGMIATATGALFVLIWIVSPRYGLAKHLLPHRKPMDMGEDMGQGEASPAV